MFEKEAEEYFGKKSELVEVEKLKIYTDGLKEGYNKAFVEADKNLKAVVADFNKANEWHYVKDGDLPPLNTNVLVIHRWARTPEVGKRIEVFINSSVWVWAMCSDRYRYTSDDKNVIAWKEIVLPELKESE